VLEAAEADEGVVTLAVATYSMGDAAGPVPVVTYGSPPEIRFDEAIDLGSIPTPMSGCSRMCCRLGDTLWKTSRLRRTAHGERL
jgi:hypothetical protein